MTRLTPWVSARTAADTLAVSTRTLQRWRSAGLLKPGRHYLRKFRGANSPLLYDLQAVEAAMRAAAARDPQTLEK